MKTPLLASLLQDNPIVVTGMGSYSSAGDSVAALWQAAMAAKSLAEWREFPMSGESRQRFAVCAAPPIDPAARPTGFVRRADRCCQMAWHAGRQAWQQAGLTGACLPERIGVIVGSSRGPVVKMAEAFDRLERGDIPPTLVAECSLGSLAGTLAQAFGAKGPGSVISATCASAAFAIGQAAEQILLGKLDAVLVGGTEAPLHSAVLAQLQASGVLGSAAEAARACRPFDATRDGMVLGEGAGFLVLEPASFALRRGARPLAMLAGWSTMVDSLGRAGVQGDGSSVARAMEEALELAQFSPRQIGYVNAHGSGTVANDLAESAALGRVFGERAILCGSSKPVTGHCLGATAALEAILCVEALRHQKCPPTVNCAEPDPRCAVQLVSPLAPPAKLNSVLSNSLGFWGYHASLIFSVAQPQSVSSRSL